MFSVLISHLQCDTNQTSLTLPGDHQRKKGSSFIQQSSFQLTTLCPRQLLKTDVWWKWNSNQTGVFYAPHTKDIQRTAISRFSSEGTKKGRCLCFLRLQSNYILYIQTNLLEKLKGWHSQCWMCVVTTFMDRDACLDSILVYVQIQIKVGGWIPPPV